MTTCRSTDAGGSRAHSAGGTLYGMYVIALAAALGAAERGVTTLFAGPDRTAIRAAAAALAEQSGRTILRVDLEQLVTKYPGETEKNVNRVFAEAERSGAILFFDEADAIFGRDAGAGVDISRFVEYLVARKESLGVSAVLVVADSSLLPADALERIDYVLSFDSP